MQFKLDIISNGRIFLSLSTSIGSIAVLSFADWETYRQFQGDLEGFYKLHHTEVPEAFKGVFENKE